MAVKLVNLIAQELVVLVQLLVETLVAAMVELADMFLVAHKAVVVEQGDILAMVVQEQTLQALLDRLVQAEAVVVVE
jgi:hypothetical protein